MKIKKILSDSDDYPKKLLALADAPKELYVLGAGVDELQARPAVRLSEAAK